MYFAPLIFNTLSTIFLAAGHKFNCCTAMDKLLIQVFLPLSDHNGHSFPGEWYKQISTSLTERFGGVTIYQRAPVTGLWKEEEQHTVRDDLIIYEVMVDKVQKDYWEPFKKQLEQQFRQDSILIRSSPIQIL